MKQIQPFQVWVNGVIYTAVYLKMLCNSDNLVDTAVFYYGLLDATAAENPFGTPIVTGNITMTGADYAAYSSIPTSNDYAYSWGARTLGLTLV